MTKERFQQCRQGPSPSGDKMPVFLAGGLALSDEFNSHSGTEKILSRVSIGLGSLAGSHYTEMWAERRSNLLMSCRMNLVRKGSVPDL